MGKKNTPPGMPLRPVIPFSEDPDKITSATPEECLDEVNRVVGMFPDRIVTRNQFRVESKLAESAWNCHWGSFEEMKRAAGVKLSRHQHRLERDIAKHASVDYMRRLNEEKSDREGTYARPSGKKFQTILVGSDIHDTECDPFWRRCFIDTARRVQPEKIILNGDTFDLPEFGKYNVDPRQWDVVGRIRWVHEFFKDLREVAPDSEMTQIEGNHEFRLLRHLAEATPALQVVLADLHKFSVSKLLGLDEFQVNYVARTDLGTFTERDIHKELKKNYLVIYQAVVAHHFPHARHMGMPGWNGHHHKHIVWPFYSPQYGAYEWHQLGCGHRRAASYCEGEKWQTGFLLAHVNTETLHTQMEYIELRDHAFIGGKFYERTPEEA